MRYAITRVFPDPAPARINSGPSVCRTADRCGGLSEERKSMRKGEGLRPGAQAERKRDPRIAGADRRPVGRRYCETWQFPQCDCLDHEMFLSEAPGPWSDRVVISN